MTRLIALILCIAILFVSCSSPVSVAVEEKQEKVEKNEVLECEDIEVKYSH